MTENGPRQRAPRLSMTTFTTGPRRKSVRLTPQSGIPLSTGGGGTGEQVALSIREAMPLQTPDPWENIFLLRKPPLLGPWTTAPAAQHRNRPFPFLPMRVGWECQELSSKLRALGAGTHRAAHGTGPRPPNTAGRPGLWDHQALGQSFTPCQRWQTTKQLAGSQVNTTKATSVSPCPEHD